jgi:hypothetical protein
MDGVCYPKDYQYDFLHWALDLGFYYCAGLWQCALFPELWEENEEVTYAG